MELFQILGMILCCMDKLKISVKYLIPWGPSFFKCKFEMLSGPIAFDALAFLMASLVWLTVNWSISDKGLDFKSFEIFLVALELLCRITEQYWSLKAFASFFGLEIYLPLNLIPIFSLLLSPFPFKALMSLKSLVEQVLGSIFSTVSRHSCSLEVLIIWSISVFSTLIWGSVGSAGPSLYS